MTYPNQRTIHINREAAKSDFLGIKNLNWQSAAHDLGAHALMLYLYLASNANGYNLALSPAAITQAIGMPRSTYHDQFQKLVNKGYLVANGSNNYEFYELPQTRNATLKTQMSDDGLKIDEKTSADVENGQAVNDVLSEDIEINNSKYSTNKNSINTIGVPIEEKKNIIEPPKKIVVTIPIPKRQPKKGFEF